jgi:hypothetical protein
MKVEKNGKSGAYIFKGKRRNCEVRCFQVTTSSKKVKKNGKSSKEIAAKYQFIF